MHKTTNHHQHSHRRHRHHPVRHLARHQAARHQHKSHKRRPSNATLRDSIRVTLGGRRWQSWAGALVVALFGVGYAAHAHASRQPEAAQQARQPTSQQASEPGTPSAAASTAPLSRPRPAPASARTQVMPPKARSEQVQAYNTDGSPLASFTPGSRTVLMHGAPRTFAEPGTTSATVTTTAWVRLYPVVFTGTIDKAWLAQMAAQNTGTASPDMLALAMQYVTGAPAVKDRTGRLISSDASYGPLQPGGQREEGADFNDYLGVRWTYGTTVDRPEIRQAGSLDCSGFVRMVWGYRGGLPLAHLDQAATGGALPRRAFQMYESGPGVVVTPDAKRQVKDFARLQAGDIVFFDIESNDGAQIDHVGMYLGVDSEGHQRVVSSRKTADGPTLGDVGGKSILDGGGLFAEGFRAARRF